MSDRPTVPLGPVLLVNFIGTLGFSIVIPFLVFLVQDFGGNGVIYGLVGATYPAFQFFGAPVLGRWSDRMGRKRVLLISQLGTLLSWGIFSIALFLPVTELAKVDAPLLGEFTITVPLLVVFVARALDGLTGGNISVANAYVADISTDETRSTNFGRMGVAANLGLVLGPASASALGGTAMGESLPVFAALLISLVASAAIAFVLPESSPCVHRGTHHQNAGKALGQEPRDCMATQDREGSGISTKEALAQPNVLFILALYFVILLSFNFYYAAFPMHAADNLGWTSVETGIFFAVLSLLMVIVQGPVLAWLSSRTREPQRIIAGLVILGTNFLLMQSNNIALIYLGALFFAVGNGIMWPSMVSTVAAIAGKRMQGTVQGMAGSAGSLASVGGMIVGGIVFAALGSATFIVSAVLAYISFALAFRLLRIAPEPA